MASAVRTVAAMGFFFLLSFLAACGSIENRPDPEQADGEIAVIEGYWRYLFLYTEQLGISSVDGKRTDGFLGYVGSVRIPPGIHWIEFTLQRNYGTVARCAFELPFDAQRHYQIKALNYDGIIAHPLTSPYKGSIAIAVAAPGKPAGALSVTALCAQTAILCRQDSDCAPKHSCRMTPGLDFGTCNPTER